MQRKLVGNEHPDVADSLNNLGLVLEDQGKLADAETVHREAQSMWRKLVGNEHPNIATSLGNLARVLEKQDRLAEAETVFREALAMNRKLLGDEHPYVANSFIGLASVLEKENKLGEAETVFREALAIQVAITRRSATNDPPSLEERKARGMSDLAQNLYRQSKYAEAETLYREVIELDKARLGPEALDGVGTVASLGRLLTDWAWAERGAIAPPSSLQAGDGSAKQIAARAPHQRAQEAERLLRQCLAIRLRDPKAVPWRIDDVRSRLGGALVAVSVTDPALNTESRLAKFAEAESLLLEGNEALQQRGKAESKYKRDALNPSRPPLRSLGQGAENCRVARTIGRVRESRSGCCARQGSGSIHP